MPYSVFDAFSNAQDIQYSTPPFANTSWSSDFIASGSVLKYVSLGWDVSTITNVQLFYA